MEFDPLTDYPLGTRRPDLVGTSSGRPFSEVTLDAARAGDARRRRSPRNVRHARAPVRGRPRSRPKPAGRQPRPRRRARRGPRHRAARDLHRASSRPFDRRRVGGGSGSAFGARRSSDRGVRPRGRGGLRRARVAPCLTEPSPASLRALRGPSGDRPPARAPRRAVGRARARRPRRAERPRPRARRRGRSGDAPRRTRSR